MQEKDLVDADTSQSLYELHSGPYSFLCTDESKHVSTQLRVELSYRATVYYGATCLELNWFCSSRSFPAWRSSAATFDHLTWLALPSLQLTIVVVDLARQVMLCLPWTSSRCGGDTIALHHHFDQWIRFALRSHKTWLIMLWLWLDLYLLSLVVCGRVK